MSEKEKGSLLNCPFCNEKASIETRTAMDNGFPERDCFQYVIECCVKMKINGDSYWNGFPTPPESTSDLKAKEQLILNWNTRLNK
jgi:hypothetical protein